MATVNENDRAARAILPRYILDDFIEWIQVNMKPYDVFNDKQLSAWAEENGYTKEKE